MRYASLLIILCVTCLIGVGLVMLTSTGAWVRGDNPDYFVTMQSIYAVFGLFMVFVVNFIDLEFYRRWSKWIYVICALLLIGCYIPGVKIEIYGASRWIKFPLIKQFQPSELARLCLVIGLSTWFARYQAEVKTFWKGFVQPGIIAGVLVLLIAAETDVGSALSMSVGVATIFFCLGVRLIYMLPVGLSACSVAYWYVMHNENRRARIDAWLDLENPIHQLDKGMQQWRALLALGNGGVEGVGLGNGVEKFGTLTFSHIDFIFPVIGEELGLRGTLLMVMAYLIIGLAGLFISMKAQTVYLRSMAIGLTMMIVVPAFVNMAVTTALFPNDGLPLPFVSYGGSSLVFTMISVGLLIAIDRKTVTIQPQQYPVDLNDRHAYRL